MLDKGFKDAVSMEKTPHQLSFLGLNVAVGNMSENGKACQICLIAVIRYRGFGESLPKFTPGTGLLAIASKQLIVERSRHGDRL